MNHPNLLRGKTRPVDYIDSILATLNPTSSDLNQDDLAIRDNNDSCQAQQRIQHLTETILSVDEPRKLTGTLIQDPSKGKIPEFKFIKMFSTSIQSDGQERDDDENQNPANWFGWIDSNRLQGSLDSIDLDCIPNDIQQAQQWSLKPPTCVSKRTSGSNPRKLTNHPLKHSNHSSVPSPSLVTEAVHTVHVPSSIPKLSENQDPLESRQSSHSRQDSLSSGVRLSDFNLAPSQLEMKELEDINRFITGEVFGSQPLL